MALVSIANSEMNTYPLSKAALNIICLAKNPNRGGTPMKEKSVIAKLTANKGLK